MNLNNSVNKVICCGLESWDSFPSRDRDLPLLHCIMNRCREYSSHSTMSTKSYFPGDKVAKADHSPSKYMDFISTSPLAFIGVMLNGEVGLFEGSYLSLKSEEWI
jgi:hypothetical protein